VDSVVINGQATLFDRHSRFDKEILPLLDPALRDWLFNLTPAKKDRLEEIRLRAGQPILLRFAKEEFTLTAKGELVKDLAYGYRIDQQALLTTLDIMTQSSLYAWEEEIKNGFITLRGGHRVGLSGKVTLEAGQVKTIKYVSGLNIRLSKEIKGVGRKVLPYLLKDHQLQNTLIISPPQAGKTTLLRDLTRLISSGVVELGLRGVNVGVVDERSELAGCWEGIPQNDLGPRTDVLDCCPKAQGMIMLLRAMAPQVLVTDELGRQGDMSAIEEAVNSGVNVLTSVHGEDELDVRRKPSLREVLESGVFSRIVVLSRRMNVGTVEKIIDCTHNKNLLNSPLALAGRE
jgi:stage III sporulation protein AA